MFSGSALNAGVAFTTSIIIARKLGPDEFGVLQISLAYFYIILTLENLINPHFFKKLLIEDPEKANFYITQLGSLIAIIAISSTLFLLTVYVVFGSSEILLTLIISASLFFRISNGIVFFNETQLNSSLSVIAQNTGNLISACIRSLSAFLSPTALLQAVLIPVQYIITFFLLTKNFRNFKINSFANIDFKMLKNLIYLSFPLFLSQLIEIIFNRVGLIVIDHELNKASIGIYSAAIKLAEPWTFIGFAIISSFLPKTVILRKTNNEKYSRHLTLVYGLLFWISILTSIFVSSFAELIISTFLNEKYLVAVPILQIHIYVLLLINWTYLTNLWEMNEGLSKITLIKNSIALTLNIILTKMFISEWGLIGATYSTLITYAFTSILSCLIFRSHRDLFKIQISSPIKVFKEVTFYLSNR